MPLPSFLTSKPKLKPKPGRQAEPDRTGDDGPVIEAARTRARRRLVGAVVLLAAGVVGFPLIFETQPRPIAVDIPIHTPKRDAASAPAARRPAPTPLPVVAEAPAETEPAAASAPPPAPTEVVEAPKPAPASAAASAPAAPPAVVAKAEDGKRAKALLDGGAAPAASSASAPKGSRFIVQVGAYTDAASVREARAKVEKLGLTSYTQVIDADGTKRTRVRVGPFPSRQEADSVGAKLKSAGLPVHILTL